MLVSYWEGLPLGPRDGQAFMGPGLLGGLAMVLGLSLLAGLLLTLRRGWVALVVAIGLALGTAVAVTSLQLVDLRSLLLLPLVVPAALLVRLPTAGAFRIVIAGGSASAALGAVAYLSGPAAWLTKGIDGSVLVAWVALAALAIVPNVLARRRDA